MMFSCPVMHFCSQVLPLTRSFSWSLAASKGCEVVIMIFMPINQFVAIWLIREVHSIVLRNCTKQQPLC